MDMPPDVLSNGVTRAPAGRLKISGPRSPIITLPPDNMFAPSAAFGMAASAVAMAVTLAIAPAAGPALAPIVASETIAAAVDHAVAIAVAIAIDADNITPWNA